MITTFVTLLAPLLLQSPAPDGSPADATLSASTSTSAPTSSASVEDLRTRIHAMRMSLLFGGEKVKGAEGEAIDFYNQRIESVNRSLDTLHTDLAERRVAYEVALEQALSRKDGAAGAVQRAQALRGEIGALEQESGVLSSARANLGKLVQAVQARQRERETLQARLDASVGLDMEASFSLGSVGLAPEVQVRPNASPFEDQRLVHDLVARDPVAAAQLLFEAGPEEYFRLFPLNPPADSLRQALPFPLPDLPGKR